MDIRPKALVVLTPAFPGNESETHWVPTQQLFVKTLKALFPGLTIKVLSFYYPYQRLPYEWNGLSVTPFHGTMQRKLRRVSFYTSVWRTLQSIRREFELTGLFSFWCGECALMGHYFGKRYGIPHYCWLCGGDAKAENKLVKFIRPAPGELIAMSDFLVREFEKNHGIRPAHMIPNAIVPDVFPAFPVDEPSPSGSFFAADKRDIDILGAGSLSPLKRYDLLVNIVGALKDSMPSIKAIHCGEGADRGKIEGLIRDAHLEYNFTLLGEKAHSEVLGLMQRTRVFLHTSGYEGFGVVCLEALYAGAKVISFSKPLDRDIENWYTVDNIGEMTRKAAEILSDPSVDYRPSLEYTMNDTVKAVMKLFGQETGNQAEG